MGEVVDLIPAAVRTLPTRSFELAVESYSCAIRDVEENPNARVDARRHRAVLVDEWERVQDHVVDEMTRLSATPAGLRAACVWIVTRVFASVDVRLHDQGYGVPRRHVCRVLTEATPGTPVNVR